LGIFRRKIEVTLKEKNWEEGEVGAGAGVGGGEGDGEEGR
jgi:hypothetical protein